MLNNYHNCVWNFTDSFTETDHVQRFGCRNCITVKVQEKSVAVKGQALFLVKVKGQGPFLILT